MDARCPNLCSNTWTMSFYLGRSADLVNSTPVCVWEPGEPEMIRRRQVTVNVVNYLHHVTIVMSGITIAINSRHKQLCLANPICGLIHVFMFTQPSTGCHEK